MGLQWTQDGMVLMREAGYTSYRLRRENLMSQSTMTKIRQGKPIAWADIEKICRFAGKQPQDFLEYVPEEE